MFYRDCDDSISADSGQSDVALVILARQPDGWGTRSQDGRSMMPCLDTLKLVTVSVCGATSMYTLEKHHNTSHLYP